MSYTSFNSVFTYGGFNNRQAATTYGSSYRYYGPDSYPSSSTSPSTSGTGPRYPSSLYRSKMDSGNSASSKMDGNKAGSSSLASSSASRLDSGRPLATNNSSSILFASSTATGATSSMSSSSSAAAAVKEKNLTANGLGANYMTNYSPSLSNYKHMFTQIAQINDHLYLSSLNAINVERLRGLKITLVVSAIVESPPLRTASDIEVLHVPIEDTEYANIRNYFDRVADRIHAEEVRGGRALVHCMAGISRSTTLVLAYLMKYTRMNLRTAFDCVRARRPYVHPNAGFWKQLVDYEERLFGSRSVKMVPAGPNRSMVPDFLAGEAAGGGTTSGTGMRIFGKLRSPFSRF